MIPAAFEYERAGSVDEAIALLGRDEDAKLLAGGHSLIPAMRLRFARPSLLVDIGRLDELRYVREDGDRIAIGALTRHAELVRDPVLARACALIARGRRADRRPAGAPPRHDRRLGRARRSGLRSRRRSCSRSTPSSSRADRTASGRSRRRSSSPARSTPRSSSRRCSPRSGCRRSAADVPEARAARAGLGDGRRRCGPRRRTRPGRPDEHGPDAVARAGVEEALAGGASPADAAAHRRRHRSAGGSVSSAACAAASAGEAPPASAASTLRARNGVGPMLVRPTCTTPSTRAAATPTVAQSWARRTCLRYVPTAFGTRISVSISCCSSALSNGPVKNAAAGIVRSPSGPCATSSASSVSRIVRQVGCRIAVRDRAADRAAVAHLRVADQRGGLADQRAVLA